MEVGTLELIELDETILEENVKCDIMKDIECENDATYQYICVSCRAGRYFCCDVHYATWRQEIEHAYKHEHVGMWCRNTERPLTYEDCLNSMQPLV